MKARHTSASTSRTRSLVTRSALVALLLASACAPGRTDEAPPAPARPTVMPDVVTTSVAHVDARLGVPSFVWITRRDLPRFSSSTEAATLVVRGLRGAFGLDDAALEALGKPEIHDAGVGPVIARFKQRAGDVEVFRGGLSIAMTRDFEPISASGLVAPKLEGAPRTFELRPREALDHVLASMLGGATAVSEIDAAHGYARFTAAGLRQPARVKRVLFPVKEGTSVAVEPAYYVEVMTKRAGARSFVVSASASGGGAILFENDLTRHEAATYRVWASPSNKLPMDSPYGNDFAPHPSGRPDGFRPAYVASQLVTLDNFPFSKNDPWLPAGATTTSGNNVEAYADLSGQDGFDGADVRPDLTGPRTFDFLYDTSKGPQLNATQIKAATTHLFYMVNFMHDWFYDSGFDEKSGNHQVDNYGRGGRAGDPILAEAQDFSGTNNANAATPSDGASPIIQMFQFNGPSPAELNVTTPANIAGPKPAGTAGFGKESFDVTGTLVVAQDGQGADASDACEPLTNNVTGRIVLVHRGLCSFVQKAQNVEAAGGLAVIVANVATSAQPETPPFMGGTALDVTIPILSVALADGKALEGNVGAGVTLKMKREAQVDLDGALDSLIVAHEWGHVLSNRLVADGNGLTTNQAGGLGEGWSDFVALLLQARDDDPFTSAGKNWAGAYPSAGYATAGFGSDYYFGIRRVPYSVDPTRDPLTFKHVENGVALPTNVPVSFGEDGSFNSEVHAAGEVWASMLWECYVSLLRDSRYTYSQAQERMKRYLVASLKLTPADPTFLEARDAVLAAAYATDEKDFRLFFDAFARRGAGVGAVAAPKDSATNAGVKESFFVGNDITVEKVTFTDDVISCDKDGILDAGEVGTVSVVVRNSGVGPLTQTSMRLVAPFAMSFPDGERAGLATLKPFETATIRLRTSFEVAPAERPVALEVQVDDPTLVNSRTIKVALPTNLDADEAEASSTIDRFDTSGTSWTAGGTGGKKWSRVRSASGDGVWSVPDTVSISDQRLTSAPFTIENDTFTLVYKHRFSFRRSTRRNTDIDGGVVEVSTNGTVWKDVAELGTVDYNAKLDTAGRGDNPIKGRAAYGGKSAGYPDAWVTSTAEVKLPSKPESVQVRFRQGTGSGFTASPGWEIDTVEIKGATSKPFWGYVPHGDHCDPQGPTADAGPPKTLKARTIGTLTGTGTHPTNLPINFTWAQVAGPPAVLRNQFTPTLSFDTPDTQETKVVTFVLRTNDGARLSPASKVDVTVVRNDPVVERFEIGGGCSSSPARAPGGAAGAAAFGAFAWLAARRRRRAP